MSRAAGYDNSVRNRRALGVQQVYAVYFKARTTIAQAFDLKRVLHLRQDGYSVQRGSPPLIKFTLISIKISL